MGCGASASASRRPTGAKHEVLPEFDAATGLPTLLGTLDGVLPEPPKPEDDPPWGAQVTLVEAAAAELGLDIDAARAETRASAATKLQALQRGKLARAEVRRLRLEREQDVDAFSIVLSSPGAESSLAAAAVAEQQPTAGWQTHARKAAVPDWEWVEMKVEEMDIVVIDDDDTATTASSGGSSQKMELPAAKLPSLQGGFSHRYRSREGTAAQLAASGIRVISLDRKVAQLAAKGWRPAVAQQQNGGA